MNNNNKRLLVLLIVVATTLFGQVYMKPLGTDFRVSIGIIALTVFLLRFDTISIFKTCLLTGLTILTFRTVLDYFPDQTNVIDILIVHLPSAMFYIMFGIILETLKFRELVSKPVVCFVIIAIADIGANLVELILRGDIYDKDLEIISISIIMSGVVRACISYVLYLSEKLYSLLITSKEQRQKYKEFVIMRASIKSEIFFMQKSMEDIEISMKDSFSLYRQLNGKTDGLNQEEVLSMKNKVLGISKGIHEIKKDYSRIIAGMGNVIPDLGFTKYKNSDEIFDILKEVTEKYIVKTGKNIEFVIEINRHFPIFEYLSLISILNNLIINSIDAIDKKGWVNLEVIEKQDVIEFVILDNGNGIKDKNRDAIFNPGFSTKFDKTTGKMSTGIGLAHVKHIVEKSFDGMIEVESVQNRYTKFLVQLARRKLCLGGSDE